MTTHLSFTYPDFAAEGAETLVVLGRRAALLDDGLAGLLPQTVRGSWRAMVNSLSPGDSGASTSTWTGGDGPARVVVCALPELASRYNSPGRPDAITALLSSGLPSKGDASVLIALDQGAHAFAAGCAVARALPTYRRKSGEPPPDRDVRVGFYALQGEPGDLHRIDRAAEGIRLAGRLSDTPTSELGTEEFVALVQSLELDIDVNVIVGEELKDSGFGGLWGVGKAATQPPALVVLNYTPEGAERTVAWVGKGIVYDTGGLSIKPKTGLVGMKRDMGGAAAVLAAFIAAVELGFPDNLHALLCLADNAVGPDAFRPDDILTLYSGKTVEVNNTDAEGRLVLADGLAFATKHLQPDVVVDVATLTGAQLVSTGRKTAAIVCNDADLEGLAVRAGRSSGDLVHPMPYFPEFVRPEFRSEVADLKNSVKDRMNAQVSAAAQFIAEHLGDYQGPWLHVDMAGPGDQRGAGYGVALLLELFGAR